MSAEEHSAEIAQTWRHCRWFEPHPAVATPGSEVSEVRATGRPGAKCATCGEALTSDVSTPPGKRGAA